jgi:hypothetical protein
MGEDGLWTMVTPALSVTVPSQAPVPPPQAWRSGRVEIRRRRIGNFNRVFMVCTLDRGLVFKSELV